MVDNKPLSTNDLIEKLDEFIDYVDSAGETLNYMEYLYDGNEYYRNKSCHILMDLRSEISSFQEEIEQQDTYLDVINAFKYFVRLITHPKRKYSIGLANEIVYKKYGIDILEISGRSNWRAKND